MRRAAPRTMLRSSFLAGSRAARSHAGTVRSCLADEAAGWSAPFSATSGTGRVDLGLSGRPWERAGRRFRVPVTLLCENSADCSVSEAMNLLYSIDLAYVFSGFCVGSLVGLTGVGGGSLMTPLLVLIFGLHPVSAVGTDLLYAAATKTVGTIVHGIGARIDWKIVARLASGSLPSAALTVWIMSHFDLEGGPARRVISSLLGVALVATAITIVLRPWLIAHLGARAGPSSGRRTPILTVLTGVALGVLVSLTSVGGGALGVTAMVLLYPGVPLGRIVGSDIAHAAPLTLVAGIGHLIAGTVNGTILLSLLIGSPLGVIAGSRAVGWVPERGLRLTLATVLTVVGGKLAF
jgi:uncharacterized protein